MQFDDELKPRRAWCSWEVRWRIAGPTTRLLVYLRPRVPHRVKATVSTTNEI